MKILFATDGSPSSEAAGEFLKQLPLPAGTAIQVVSVALGWIASGGLTMEGITVSELPERLLEADRQRTLAVLDRTAATLAREGLAVTTGLRHGGPVP
jgi:hypothetical protein